MAGGHRITPNDARIMREMRKIIGAGKGVLSKRPVPTRRRGRGGGGGGVGEVNVRFGRATEDIPAATDWSIEGAGTGSAVYKDSSGADDDGAGGSTPFTVYNRYFNLIPEDSAVWIFDSGGQRFVINIGCTPGIPPET